MKYFVILMLLVGFVGFAYAIPEFIDSEKVYAADVIAIGQILSYHDEEKYRFYEISILRELKNTLPDNIITMRSISENGFDSIDPHNVFVNGDLVLLYLKDYGRGFWESTNFSSTISDGQMQNTIVKITELVLQTEKQSPEPPMEFEPVIEPEPILTKKQLADGQIFCIGGYKQVGSECVPDDGLKIFNYEIFYVVLLIILIVIFSVIIYVWRKRK